MYYLDELHVFMLSVHPDSCDVKEEVFGCSMNKMWPDF